MPTATDHAEDEARAEETAALLGELIRFDTTNPPGNERALQEMLSARLTAAGFECELLGEDPERPSLVANLHGSEPGPTLALLGHADVVPAQAEDWSFDPFGGEISADGEVRGRGAQDMKGQVAAEATACLRLARSGWLPRGTLRLITTCDEERGALGAQWLCEQRPEKVRSDFVINEGGGPAFEAGARRFYGLCVGEKGIFRFRLRARGRPGHASTPALGDNALLKLAPALEALRSQPPLDPTPEGTTFLSRVLGREIAAERGPGLDEALGELAELAPEIAAILAEPMLRVTVVPTFAKASEKLNVTPGSAELVVDCRVPPEMEGAEVLERIEAVLGTDHAGLELEFTQTTVGNRTELGSELEAAIGRWLADADPGATLVPMTLAGFSDSNLFRKAFPDATVVGFNPQRAMGVLEAAPLIHGIDERAAVSDLGLAASFYEWIAKEMLG